MGRLDDAAKSYREAIRLKPDYTDAHNNLGNVMQALGRLDEAMAEYRMAIAADPNCAGAHNNLGIVLAARGRLDEAKEEYRKALEIQPDFFLAYRNLGNVLFAQGRLDEAMRQYRKVLEIKPDYVEVLNNLAWLLATHPKASQRDGVKAIALAERANRLCGGQQPGALDTLAAAYAEAGRFSDALATARKALELAKRQDSRPMADSLRARIALYEAGKPYHQTLPAKAGTEAVP